MSNSEGKKIVALDFDGVLCNSVGESSRSAFRCLQTRYPEVLAGTQWEKLDDADAPDWLIHKMRLLRPVVETGYENILLARLLLDEYKIARSEENTTGYRALTMGEIAANWSGHLKDTLIRKYDTTKEELVEAFGTTRDEWMARDSESWLDANTFYERLGILDAAKECTANMYIITTKQQRFAAALIKHAGLTVPDDRLFGLGTGPKTDVLAQLIEQHPGSEIHFVEDRVETLEGICKDNRLNSVHLYLADWGFNDVEQRLKGANNPRIEVISPKGFRDVMVSKVTSSS